MMPKVMLWTFGQKFQYDYVRYKKMTTKLKEYVLQSLKFVIKIHTNRE